MSSKKAKPTGRKTAKKTTAKKAESAKPAVQPAAKPAALPAAKPARAKGRGVRYDAAKKQEVIDFVAAYNAKNGRGGQSEAARKFGITILTVSSWLKGSGVKAPKAPKVPKGTKAAKAPKEAAVSPGITNKVKALLDLGDQIRKLQAQYAALSAAIRSEI